MSNATIHIVREYHKVKYILGPTERTTEKIKKKNIVKMRESQYLTKLSGRRKHTVV